MADHGTVQKVTITPLVITDFAPSSGVPLGTVQRVTVTPVTVDNYSIGGTLPPPSRPTTGQLWPRGNP